MGNITESRVHCYRSNEGQGAWETTTVSTWRGCLITSREKAFLKLEEIRKCPFCGRDLVEGFMNAPRGLYLDTKKHGWADWGGRIKLSPSVYLRLKDVPVRFCVECNVLIASGPLRGFMKKCTKCKHEITIDEEKCEFCGAAQPKRK